MCVLKSECCPRTFSSWPLFSNMDLVWCPIWIFLNTDLPNYGFYNIDLLGYKMTREKKTINGSSSLSRHYRLWCIDSVTRFTFCVSEALIGFIFRDFAFSLRFRWHQLFSQQGQGFFSTLAFQEVFSPFAFKSVFAWTTYYSPFICTWRNRSLPIFIELMCFRGNI